MILGKMSIHCKGKCSCYKKAQQMEKKVNLYTCENAKKSLR